MSSKSFVSSLNTHLAYSQLALFSENSSVLQISSLRKSHSWLCKCVISLSYRSLLLQSTRPPCLVFLLRKRATILFANLLDLSMCYVIITIFLLQIVSIIFSTSCVICDCSIFCCVYTILFYQTQIPQDLSFVSRLLVSPVHLPSQMLTSIY